MSLEQLQLLKNAQGKIHAFIHEKYKNLPDTKKDVSYGYMFRCDMITGEVVNIGSIWADETIHDDVENIPNHQFLMGVSITNWIDETKAHYFAFNMMVTKWEQFYEWIPAQIVKEIKYLTVKDVKEFTWYPNENLDENTIVGIDAPNMYWVPIVDGAYINPKENT